ncbi:hypothetical protein GmHk_15G044467 [Glycine max]|nr:hypothetical protein GmHk_15G044467 [Glycine max]
MQFIETTKSTQRALQSVEIQVGGLAEAVTQFMVRQEKSFVEVEAQKKIPVKEHESREKDEEKDEEQAQQQWENYSTVENQQENILQSNNLPHQLTDKKGRQGEHEETLRAILSLITNTFLEMIWNVFPDYMKFMKFLAKSRALSRAFLSQAQLVAASAELSELHSLSSHNLSFEAWTEYTDNVLGRHILAERKLEIYHTELDEFKGELERRNFHKRLTNLADSSIDLALVKELYANLYSPEGPSPKQGHLIRIDADSLNAFLETPVVLAEGESLPTYSRYYRLPTDFKEIEAALCIPGQGFILNSKGHPGRILRKDLTTLAQVWSVLSYSNLAPTSHTSDLTVDRARLIFGLVSHLDMNIGALIYGQMTSIAQSNTSRLGFPALIIALCRARGVVSDSLTFERLSPVINLAYIRKNCWNPEDLTVSIRGARRARARPAELPSTSAAPTPASTSAAPSVPAQTNSQHFEAMLQSIHQG